jgi:hypothetical protein
LSTTYEVLTSFCDSKWVDLAWIRTIKHSNSLSIKAIPVSDLSVTSSGKHLGLVWVIQNLFEHCRFKETHDSCVVYDVPDDAWAVIWRRDSLGVSFVDSDVWDSASVFFQWALHDLGLSSDSPDSYFTFHTTRYYFLAIVRSADGSYTVVVGVVDGVQKLTWLRQESSDFSIIPSRENWFAVTREVDAEAFKSWDFNS